MPVDTEMSEFLLTEAKVFFVNGFCKVFAFSGRDNGCEKENLGDDDEDEFCHEWRIMWYVFYFF